MSFSFFKLKRILLLVCGLLLAFAALAASDNADLETMAVRATGGATLSPAFSPKHTRYAVQLPTDIGALQIRGSAWNGRSKLRINDQPVASLDWRRIALKPGANRISFQVTAPDGVASREYVIDVTREDAAPLTETFLRLTHRDAASGLVMPYRLFVPKGAGAGTTRYPLVMFLHGGGQGGSDNEKHLVGSEGALVWAKAEEQARRPAFVLAPQGRDYMNGAADLPIGGFGITRDRQGDRYMTEVLTPSNDVHRALAVLEQVMREYPVDPKRVYVTGYSQGGFGTWNMALLRPDLFAAIVPIAGGGDPAQVSRIRDLPVWGFQAEDDQVVQASYMRATIEALRKLGAQPRYTELPSGTFFDPNEHWSWVFAYRNEAMREWLFAQRRP